MVKFRRGGGLSENLEDRRGRGGLALGGGAAGIVGIIITLLLNASGGGGGGIDITDIFSQIQGGGTSGTVDPADEPLVEEMSAALDDIQAFWASEEGLGAAYRDARLVLFTNQVSTGGCGSAPSSVGPFYCPADSQAYLDLSFFKDLDARFGAPGDFARVYVLAHELGHHVQNLLGDNARVRQESAADPGRANELSVRLELQADCYAGLWGRSAQQRGLIEPGDLEEGLAAAAAVGDDRIQAQSGSDVEPDSWTHGSSEARQRWFRAGFDDGRIQACDTFQAPRDALGL
jgi:predicted metalloprotease